MRRALLCGTCVALALAAAATGRADIGQARSVSLTVYNTDLALVREQRNVALAAGEVGVRLDGVPEGLEPRSVQARFSAGDIVVPVLEQTFRRDLLSPSRLLDLHVGREVTLVRDLPDGGEERTTATLVTTEGGPIFRVGDELHLQHPGRVILAAGTGGLTVRPALEWVLDVHSAGDHVLDLSYLTGGLSWTTVYVISLAGDRGFLSLSAWVSVDNRTGRTFENASLQLVAGLVNRVFRQPVAPRPRTARAQVMEAQPSGGGFVDESLFDYHAYTLQRRVTLPAQSTKQIALHEATEVPLTRRYVVTSSAPHALSVGRGEPQRPAVQVRVEFANDESHGLGLALPAGIARVYDQSADGASRFVGEERIGHTPAGETLSLTVGRAFDVVVERRQTDYRDAGGSGRRSYEAAFRLELRNSKTDGVTVEVRESIPGRWKILESSHPATRLDVSTAQFDVPVPAGGEAVLTYRVRVN